MPRDSRSWFAILIGCVALLRLAELALSARNGRRLRARGGVEAGGEHYPLMVGVHALFLAAAPLEVILLERPFYPALGFPMLVLVTLTLTLRFWVIATLGDRWCTKVIVIPGLPLVATGPFRLLRHPNYLAVAVEMPALALVHTAWISAAIFGGLNLMVLRTRIRVENAALEMASRGAR